MGVDEGTALRSSDTDCLCTDMGRDWVSDSVIHISSLFTVQTFMERNDEAKTTGHANECRLYIPLLFTLNTVGIQ